MLAHPRASTMSVAEASELNAESVSPVLVTCCCRNKWPQVEWWFESSCVISLWLCRMEVRHDRARALPDASLGSKVLAGGVLLLGSNSFLKLTDCWQNSVPCSCGTGVSISLKHALLSCMCQQQYVLPRCFESNASATSLRLPFLHWEERKFHI